jgi:hypothetical protein
VLIGAFVGLPGTSLTAVSDSAGRFTLGPVLPGAYRLVMQHDVLDALGISGLSASVVVADDGADLVIAVPSFATLWAGACGMVAPARDTGFIFGSVRKDGKPVSRGIVGAQWTHVVRDSGRILGVKQRTLEVDTDSTGNFALCGVPTTPTITLRARIGPGMEERVLPAFGDDRIARQDIVVLSTAAAVASTFSGVIVDSTQHPIADLEVSIPRLGIVTRTDSGGRFRLEGLPPGTHQVVARRVGYGSLEVDLEFKPGEIVDRRIVLTRIALLDSLVSTAHRYRDPLMREFEENRRIGLGHFVTRDDIRKREESPVSSFLQQIPGARVTGSYGRDFVTGGRGVRCNRQAPDVERIKRANPPAQPTGLCGVLYVPGTDEARRGVPIGCFSRVYLDNQLMNVGTPTPPFDLREISASQVEAIEFYAGSTQTPAKYMARSSECGLVIIHSRRSP